MAQQPPTSKENRNRLWYLGAGRPAAVALPGARPIDGSRSGGADSSIRGGVSTRTLPKDKGIYLSISYHQFTTSSTRLGSASIFLAAHSVSNYNLFNFFVSSLATHRIKKFVRNIIYFVVACFIIDKSSSKII